MNRHNKITLLACTFLTVLNIAACGQAEEEESSASRQESDIQASTNAEIKGDEIVNAQGVSVNQRESNVQTAGNTESETKEDEIVSAKEASANQQESSAQAVENSDSEATAEELLDLFINGSISAVDATDPTSAFYITDLTMDSEGGDSFSVGEKVDLDNDGENELIIKGPYGGMYLDARDNKVYKFAGCDGTAVILSYTWYNGAVWILYSSRSSRGFEFYHMEKFEGADNLSAEMNFGEEFDINNPEAGVKYTLNGTEITYDEYTELCSKILAAQESTD